MSANVNEFKAQLKGFNALTERQAVAAQKKVTLQILRGVIRANPVDTGRMRSAWTVGVGSPPTATPDGRSTSGEVGTSARSGAIGQGGTTLGSLKFGQPSFVVNNTSYSGHVNNHHPNKSHFVEAVIANVESALAGGGS